MATNKRGRQPHRERNSRYSFPSGFYHRIVSLVRAPLRPVIHSFRPLDLWCSQPPLPPPASRQLDSGSGCSIPNSIESYPLYVEGAKRTNYPTVSRLLSDYWWLERRVGSPPAMQEGRTLKETPDPGSGVNHDGLKELGRDPDEVVLRFEHVALLRRQNLAVHVNAQGQGRRASSPLTESPTSIWWARRHADIRTYRSGTAQLCAVKFACRASWQNHIRDGPVRWLRGA